MDNVETIWSRGRMGSMRASGGGRARPIASYQAVILFLSSHGPQPLAVLARVTGTPERRMKGRLMALWEYGFVSSVDQAGSYWRLSMRGCQLVAALRREDYTPGRGMDQPPGGVA